MADQEDGTLFPDIESGPASSSAQRALAVFVALVFLLVCTAVGLTDAIAPIEAPKLVGREKQEMEDLQKTAKVSDGTRMQYIEKTMKRTSRVRHATATRYAYGLFRAFGTVGKSGIVGPNGWVFLTDTTIPTGRPAEQIVGPSVALMTAAARRMENRGVRWVSMPIPRKSVTVAEELPSGVDPRPAIEDELVNALRRTGVDTLDIRAALAEVPANDVYQKLDTHWGPLGFRAAIRAMSLFMGVEEAPPSVSSVKVLPDVSTDVYSLRSVGIYSTSKPPAWIEIPRQRGLSVVGSRGGASPWKLPKKKMTRLALVGSSFSVGALRSQILCHYFNEPAWNGSKAGQGLIENCGTFLARTRELGLPEVLWHEFPVHLTLLMDRSTYRSKLRPDMFSMFTEEPCGPVQTVLQDAGIVAAMAPERVPAKGKRRQLWKFPRGGVVGSGDGVLSLRITRRDGKEAGAMLAVVHRDLRMQLVWKPEQTSVVVPIVEHGVTGRALSLECSDPEADFDVEFVTDLDLASPVAEVTEFTSPKKPAVVATFPEGVKVSRFAGVRVQFETKKGGARPTTVEVTAGGESLSFKFAAAPSGTALLNVGGLRGKPLETVTITGTGSPADARVISVSLHRHLRP